MANLKRGFLFRTDGTSALVTYNTTDDITRLVGVDEWTVAYRSFSGIDCVVYLDDLGLLRENPVVTAVARDFSSVLVGNLLIGREGYGGEDESISEDDFHILTNNIITLYQSEADGFKSPLMDILVFD